MEVWHCSVSNETHDRMVKAMPSELKNKKIVVNLGAGGNGNEEEYVKNGFKIINTVDSIRRAVDKKQCLITFREKKLSCLEMLDFDNEKDVKYARYIISQLEQGKDKRVSLVYKPRHEVAVHIKTLKELNHWIDEGASYVTYYIDKKEQYRVNVLCGHVINVKKYKVDPEAENPNEGGMKDNCAWIEDYIMDEKDWPKDIVKLGLQAAECIGLGLTGVDILIDETRKPRLIEVNSAPSLKTKEIKMFYDLLTKLEKKKKK